jgi:BMFP domain-containing protein YqiC
LVTNERTHQHGARISGVAPFGGLRRNAAIRRVSGLVFCPRLRYQIAMSNDSIESLAKKLADSLPGSLRSMREDLEQNFKGVLRTGLDKLDLVTREEFEVQEAVLQRTREKLEALEAKVSELEQPDT